MSVLESGSHRARCYLVSRACCTSGTGWTDVSSDNRGKSDHSSSASLSCFLCGDLERYPGLLCFVFETGSHAAQANFQVVIQLSLAPCHQLGKQECTIRLGFFIQLT